jgi:DNA-binding transcriptional ArsR family regulator
LSDDEAVRPSSSAVVQRPCESGVVEAIDLPPSAVVDSGGGFWLYWKLSELADTELIEEWNYRLNIFLRDQVPGVDRGCWNRNRCARLVGTVHEETGITAHFLPEHLSRRMYAPAEAEERIPLLPDASPDPEMASLPAPVLVEPPVGDGDVASALARFRWYWEESLSEAEVKARGQTRHQIEFALAVALVEAGCTEEEIIELFDRHALAKHVEKKRVNPGNRYGYARLTVENARAAAARKPTPVGEPRGGQAVAAKPKRAWNEADRGEILAMVDEHSHSALTVGAMVKAISERFGCTERTAENALSQLVEAGYIEKRPNPSGRGKIVVVSEKGRKFLDQQGWRKGFHLLPPINPDPHASPRRRMLRRPWRGTSKRLEDGPTHEEDRNGDDSPSCVYNPEHFGYRRTEIARHVGPDATDADLRTALRRNWIDDWYRIAFEGRKATRLIQFTTGWDEIVERVLFYDQLGVGIDVYPSPDLKLVDIVPLYRSFISQGDPRVEDGVRDLIARGRWKDWAGNWRKVKPLPFTFGLGIEFGPGGRPMTHPITAPDGQPRTLPNAGLIVMPDWSFWRALRNDAAKQGLKDIGEHLFEVKRSGPRGKHTFSFRPLGPPPDSPVPADLAIDLEQVLDELVRAHRLHAYIGPLAEGHCFWE